jgi:hypothetical protein
MVESGTTHRDFEMTLLYSDPLFLKHATGSHPECGERLTAIVARLGESGLAPRGLSSP